MEIRSFIHKIIQKHLCDSEDQDHALSSQYLGKCMYSVTVLVRSFIAISTERKC